jgi:hypothetical protein
MAFLDKLNGQEIVKRVLNVNTTSGSATTVEHSKITQRNGCELFFAHQSAVRCSKISDSKSYKVLDIPDITFEVKGIKLNSSGTLLAIYNDNNLIVSTLPSSNFMITESSLIKVKSFTIGRDIFQNNRILDLSWNSISCFDSSIVTLTDDGVIRSFGLDGSLGHPDFTYNLKSTHRNQVGYPSDVMDDPVSITFGSQSNLAGALTLYILNSDGDVFSIYPFYPEKIVASKSQVEDLLNSTVIMTNSTVDQGKQYQQRSAINQLRFVKHLWEQVPTAQLETRGSEQLYILKPDVKNKMILQGSYSIQPYPEDLYCDSAVSISMVRCGDIDLLAITYSQYGFLLTLPDLNITMKFQDQEFEEFVLLNETGETPLVLATLEFKKSQIPQPTFVSSITDSHNFFIQKGNSIYMTSLQHWSESLVGACSYGNTDAFSDLLESRLTSKLLELYSLKPGENLEGLAIIENEFSDKYISVLTNKNFIVVPISPKASKKQSQTQVGISESYDVQLGAPYFEIEKMLHATCSLKISAPPNANTPISSDENGLRDLSNVSSQVLKGLVNFHKVGLSLNHRVENQKNELSRQLDTTHDLVDRLGQVDKKKQENLEATQKAVERQRSLTERVQSLAEKLQKDVDLPLSSAEKNWFKEIQRLVLSFNKSVKQTHSLQEQFSFIKTEIDSQKNAINKNTHEHNWDEINDVLNEGKTLMEMTSKELQVNMSALGSSMSKIHI